MFVKRPTADYMCERAELSMIFMGEPNMKHILRDIIPGGPQGFGAQIGGKQYRVYVVVEEIPTADSASGEV